MTTYQIILPYETPPLSQNSRMHWAKIARTKKQLKQDIIWLANSNNLPKNAQHATVTLHYQPATRRRRDPDNLMATHKPCVDALVDYGLVPDDTPEYVTHNMTIIEPFVRYQPKLWLTIEVTP